MPIITDIQRQKKREGFYSIFVDGAFTFSLSDLELSLSSLKIGEELTEAQLQAWQQQSAMSKAYGTAINFLSYRDRTQVEIEKKLREKDYAESAIERVVERLKSERLVNDQRFAERWIETRQSLNPRSKRQLEQELRQHGIDSVTIETALAEFEKGTDTSTDVDAIIALIRKKRLRQRYADEQKLIQYLSQKGFGYGSVKQALEVAEED